VNMDKRKQNFHGKQVFRGSQVVFGDVRDQAKVVFGQIPPNPAKPDLAKILNELVELIEAAKANKEVDEADAAKAVEETTTIGEMAKKPDQPGILDRAKDAVGRVGGLLVGVGSVVAKLGELKRAVVGWFS
jgi:hypothetical protein